MKRTLIVAVLALGVAACATLDYHRQYYAGPPSDHFDGTRFFNPGGARPRGLLDLARWRLAERREDWPDAYPNPFPPDRPPRNRPGRPTGPSPSSAPMPRAGPST